MKLSALPLILGICGCCSSKDDVPVARQLGPEAYLLDEGIEDGLWATWYESGQL